MGEYDNLNRESSKGFYIGENNSHVQPTTIKPELTRSNQQREEWNGWLGERPLTPQEVVDANPHVNFRFLPSGVKYDKPTDIKPAELGSSLSREYDMEQEWGLQAELLASLFAANLGLTDKEYMRNLPKFPEKPVNTKFSIPLLVQPAVHDAGLSIATILNRTGINHNLYDLNIYEYHGTNKRDRSLKYQPYATWVHDGSMNLGKSIMDIRLGLGPHERAGGYEGIALFCRFPNILDQYSLAMPGLLTMHNTHLSLTQRQGSPQLEIGYSYETSNRYGAVVASGDVNYGSLMYK